MERDIGIEPHLSKIPEAVSGEEDKGYAPGIVMDATSSTIRGRGDGIGLVRLAREEFPDESGVSLDNFRLLPRFGIASGASFGGASAIWEEWVSAI